jgi:HPt (histidine-containing phosphotransfer) domain-containing protein
MAQAAPSRYAAIFMDMQMPELDGLGATRALRADARLAKVPIIAMTANAMKADLDACLEAGMNDHVTKPIDRKVLLAAVRRWLPHQAPAAPATHAAIAPGPVAAEDRSALEGIDVSGTLDRLGLDRATLERMLIRFADGQGATLDALRAAVAARDAAAAARHAHAIAGAAGNLGAEELRIAAKALEAAGREGRSDLSALLGVVNERANVVLQSIATLRASGTPAAAAIGSRPLDPGAASAALGRLAAALDDFDVSSASVALADVSSSGLSDWAAADVGHLRQSVESYDYDAARAIASGLLARLQEQGD